jgi:predicted TIM-barrel fold metal-dependent hydrolase
MVDMDTILQQDRAGDVVRSGPRTVTFLPEPERQARPFTIISVDDHLVEPSHMFEGRIPARFVDRAPRVVEDDSVEMWEYDGQLLPNIGLNAVSGRPVSEYGWEPARFDQMRRGAWDIESRIADMDLNGIFASMNFPSFLSGFAGQRLQLGHDPDLALAVVRAWNDFILEEWAGRYPQRIIPLQLPYLLDPKIAAAEIRSNAIKGHKAVSFSETPSALGLPSINSDYWDPFFRACEETETVLCMHFGSSGSLPETTPDLPRDGINCLFGVNLTVGVDWLYARVPMRFPNIRLCLSEGGAGWVPALLDRLDHTLKYREWFSTFADSEMTPAELFRRNFWVCAIDEPSAMVNRDRIGVDHILLESDYPHADSTWPFTQEVVGRSMRGLPPEDVRRITWQNASELFRHPVPTSVQANPDNF